MEPIRRSPGVPARATSPTTTLSPNNNPDIGQQLRRRRAAGQRLTVLGCGCADPWIHRCRGDSEATPADVDAYVATVELLDQVGYPAAPRLPELRAIWRQGDRRLVASVTTRWAVA